MLRSIEHPGVFKGRGRTWKKPFHVVKRSVNDVHVAYDIYVNNNKFLISANTQFPLKRHEAYAITKLLNSETRSLKWAEKFGDTHGRSH